MTERNTPATYFDTPARSERLQLLLHLARNAGEVVYLRAPTGAGKTRFVRRMLELLGEDLSSVWLRGGVDNDVPLVVADQLGLGENDAAEWPYSVLAALSGQDLLVVVDDADRLTLPAVERLATFHAQGGHLLLIGHGGLAQTIRDWDVQFVDLPPFDVEQSAVFLRSNAGDGADHINDDLAAFLHHAAHGRPGALLDSLDEVLNRARRHAATRGKQGGAKPRSLLPWLAGAVGVFVVAGVLFYQDQINALFEPPADTAVAASDPVPAVVAEEPPASPPPAAVEPHIEEPPADLQLESGRPPQIALPELHPLPPVELPPADAGSAMATDEGVTTDAASEDALEAVMRDVMTAAGAAAEGTTDVPAAQPAPATGSVVEQPQVPESGGDAPPLAEVAPAVAVTPPAVAPSQPAPAAVAKAIPKPKPNATPKAAARTESEPVVVSKPAVDDARDPATAAAQPAPPRVDPASRDEASAPAPVEERRPGDTPPPAVAAPAATAAPVDDRSQAAATAVAKVGPANEPVVAASPTTNPSSAQGGVAWLKGRPAQHFTLQLVGARDRASVDKFVRQHGIAQPYAVFERELNGRPWYSLVAGDYPNRDAAVTGRAHLPASLPTKDIWPRAFGSIHELLK
ncbi:MAG: SPOR domain-containing protein [Gammaproteobacteria bacterium]|nr:SPOR domain-containing protein [Gammaproteobacteria bacterium]